MVRWGIEQARRDGCNAYLEAAASAMSLYQKCGFQVVGELEFDLSEFGFERSMKLARMMWRAEAEAEAEQPESKGRTGIGMEVEGQER